MSFHSRFHWVIRRLYYSRITVTGRQNITNEGPLLVLCLHRNGAVDSFAYYEAFPHLKFLVRAKLRQGVIGHLFFPGIDVVRREDGGSTEDLDDLIENCARELESGTILGIFPEGTSDLGPRHLRFRKGAARIAARCLEQNLPLTVLPVGIHYECPWAFRSRIEIVIGPSISLGPEKGRESEKPRTREIHRRFTNALEEVGINVPDAATQDLLGRFAYTATLGTEIGYFEALKAMEKELPTEVVTAWKTLENAMQGKRILRHQGVPLFPTRALLLYSTLSVLLAIPVLAGALLNGFPLTMAWYCGRKFSDGRNVIALWRILTGVPLFILWAAFWIIACTALGHSEIALIYIIITTIAVSGWYRLKKLAVASWNGLFYPDLRADALTLHQQILNHLER
jgi:1-acyl-sn-glycerol-3-phosphate acyltransferase